VVKAPGWCGRHSLFTAARAKIINVVILECKSSGEVVVAVPVNEVVNFVNEYSRLVLEIEGEATTEGPAGPGNGGAGHLMPDTRLLSHPAVGS
jgi:hypothetical protein